MEDRINKALGQLEKDLQEINSARSQVESTVKASTELQKVVSDYVSSVQALCVGLQAWESELRAREGTVSHEYENAISRVNSTCTEIINSFSTVVKQTSTDFEDKAGSIVEMFTEQNKILTERVQDLNALKEDVKKATTEIQEIKASLSQISQDLMASQESQDSVLEDIKQNVLGLKETVTTVASKLSQEISHAKQDLLDTQNLTSSKIDSVSAKADTLAAGV